MNRLLPLRNTWAGLFQGVKGASDTPALMYTRQPPTKEYAELIVKMSDAEKERNKQLGSEKLAEKAIRGQPQQKQAPQHCLYT